MEPKKFMTPHKYFQLLFRVFFKFRTLDTQIKNWDKQQQILCALYANSYSFFFLCLFLIIIKILFIQFGFKFNLSNAMLYVAFAMAGAVVLGILGVVAAAIAFGALFGMAFALVSIAGNLVGAVAFGLASALVLGMIGSVELGWVLVVAGILTGAVAGAMELDILIAIELGTLITVKLGTFGFAFICIFLFTFSRWFYLPFFLFNLINSSPPKKWPTHWDENILAPMPFLPWFLVNAYNNKKKLLVEEAIFLISERPPQRKPAQKALTMIAYKEMLRFRNLRNIADLRQELDFLPYARNFYSKSYQEGYDSILYFSGDAQKVFQENNSSNRIKMLRRLAEDVKEFNKKMYFAKKEVGLPFGQIGRHWLMIIQNEIHQIENQYGKPLPNPFIAGRPIHADSDIFVGREDIIEKIQRESLHEGGPGAILFIGNRRTGKTSTLLNLKKYLISSIKPVFIDFQDPTVFSNQQVFSKTVAQSVQGILEKDHIICSSLAELTAYFKQLQTELVSKNQYLLLCFDEYEKLVPKILQGVLGDLPDTFRYWIQHLQRTIFLFAGSRHIDKIKEIDWTNYFINVRLVPLSYLDFESSFRLVSKPIPDPEFDLQYLPDEEIAKKLIHRLGCHPFLLQATMSELVDFLNNVQRKTVTQKDIEMAIQNMLISWHQYFYHIWNTESTEDERLILILLTENKTLHEGNHKSVQSLIRKEVLRKANDQYEFCIPVFKEWIKKHTL